MPEKLAPKLQYIEEKEIVPFKLRRYRKPMPEKPAPKLQQMTRRPTQQRYGTAQSVCKDQGCS